MKKIRIAVLASGGGTNLQALLDAQGAALVSGEVALVVTDRPGAFALERAKTAGVPAVELDRKAAGFSASLQALMEEHGIGMIITAGFLSILEGGLLEKFAGRIINVHPSLIPAFCGKGFYGLRVHRAALECGVKVTGATVHYVNEIVDGGEIILQKAVSVHEGDTPESLQQRVMAEAERVILPEAAEIVCKRLSKGE